MSILSSILPGGCFKEKDPSDKDPAKDNNNKEKSWLETVQIRSFWLLMKTENRKM